jgi:hypothetical protein
MYQTVFHPGGSVTGVVDEEDEEEEEEEEEEGDKPPNPTIVAQIETALIQGVATNDVPLLGQSVMEARNLTHKHQLLHFPISFLRALKKATDVLKKNPSYSATGQTSIPNVLKSSGMTNNTLKSSKSLASPKSPKRKKNKKKKASRLKRLKNARKVYEEHKRQSLSDGHVLMSANSLAQVFDATLVARAKGETAERHSATTLHTSTTSTTSTTSNALKSRRNKSVDGSTTTGQTRTERRRATVSHAANLIKARRNRLASGGVGGHGNARKVPPPPPPPPVAVAASMPTSDGGSGGGSTGRGRQGTATRRASLKAMGRRGSLTSTHLRALLSSIDDRGDPTTSNTTNPLMN